jgi:beta-phosphoglucomutase
MFKAIIFDCDGTLVDSEGAHFQSWRSTLQRYGEDLTLDEYILSYAGNPYEKNARLLADRIGKNHVVSQIIADKIDDFDELLKEGFPAIHGTVDFVHRLAKEKKQKDLKIALASAARRKDILSHLNHLGIAHYFDEIISGEEDLHEYKDPEGVNKPKPYIYLHAAKRLNVEPKDCIAIEDSNPGVTSAVTAGCYTIAIPNFYTQSQDFALAHKILQTLENIEIENLY